MDLVAELGAEQFPHRNVVHLADDVPARHLDTTYRPDAVQLLVGHVAWRGIRLLHRTPHLVDLRGIHPDDDRPVLAQPGLISAVEVAAFAVARDALVGFEADNEAVVVQRRLRPVQGGDIDAFLAGGNRRPGEFEGVQGGKPSDPGCSKRTQKVAPPDG